MRTKKCHNGMEGCGIEELHRHEVGGAVTWTSRHEWIYTHPADGAHLPSPCSSCATLLAEVARLRGIIEEAPHGYWCQAQAWLRFAPRSGSKCGPQPPCDCFKSALAGPKGEG